MVNLARLLRLGQASASSRGARETGVVAAMLQAREVVGSVVVASAGANKQGMVGRRAR
jgi:hypothetical protein